MNNVRASEQSDVSCWARFAANSPWILSTLRVSDAMFALVDNDTNVLLETDIDDVQGVDEVQNSVDEGHLIELTLLSGSMITLVLGSEALDVLISALRASLDNPTSAPQFDQAIAFDVSDPMQATHSNTDARFWGDTVNPDSGVVTEGLSGRTHYLKRGALVVCATALLLVGFVTVTRGEPHYGSIQEIADKITAYGINCDALETAESDVDASAPTIAGTPTSERALCRPSKEQIWISMYESGEALESEFNNVEQTGCVALHAGDGESIWVVSGDVWSVAPQTEYTAKKVQDALGGRLKSFACS